MHEVLLETPLGLHLLQPIHGRSSLSLHTPGTSGAEASAKGLDGAQPPLIFAVHRVYCEYFSLKWFNSYSFKEHVSLNKHFRSDI
jgi:hypothetical protein